MKNRAISFVILAAVYVFAAACGIALYALLPLPFWAALLVSDAVSAVAVFVFSLIFKNASVYDPYWSVQPIIITAAFAIAGPPLGAAQILLIIAVFVWGVRLTANWAYMFGDLTRQDWRYTMLQQKTGKLYPIINFVGIHLVPTLVVYCCILPAVYVIYSGAAFSPWSIAAFALSIFATTLQGAADIQMHIFKKRGGSGFIGYGLWKYSRHPNYLGEILMWWGVDLFCVATMPQCPWFIVGAAANTLLFLAVSIPMADGKQSKKEGFAQYKARTRMLLPIKKRTR